ncbi:hypothetical protein DQG13_15075 [Paenibacillus sp. YN15]|nr:hypothetical protein DQG13_15075 [Paenibacillus sp. YN15]
MHSVRITDNLSKAIRTSKVGQISKADLHDLVTPNESDKITKVFSSNVVLGDYVTQGGDWS